MPQIIRLQIDGLRNLHSVSLKPSSRFNFIYGENGSGKTSILEAISLLGRGRSFRSQKTASLINHDQQDLVAFTELQQLNHNKLSLGFQKLRNTKTQIRINGQNAHSAAELANQLPLQIINADSFQLIEGSPQQRRRFLDWMVFHVKPEFIDYWRRLQRVIKQRNSLLRHDKITRLDLAPWDKEFVELSAGLDKLRQEVFEEFLAVAKSLTSTFSKTIADIDMSYLNGWPDNTHDYEQALENDFRRDLRHGYTHWGPQRADIRFTLSGKMAAEVLSRGQEKSLISSLHISQAKLYQEKRGMPCVFLIDDLMAELDYGNAEKLIGWLNTLGSQVFITGVLEEHFINLSEKQLLEDYALFHVKHGEVIQEKLEINIDY